MKRVELDDAPAPPPDDDVLALDEALTRLELEDPVAARVVEFATSLVWATKTSRPRSASPFTWPARNGPMPGPGSETHSATTDFLFFRQPCLKRRTVR